MLRVKCGGGENRTRLSRSTNTIRRMELVGDGSGIHQQQALGSGVIVDPKGLIMTASHVVHSADRIVVEFTDGQQLEAPFQLPKSNQSE